MRPRPVGYEGVVSVIEKHRGLTISVPDLSKLLGVKPTTLNARFRRERIAVRTVGRTNYIPCELALRLAELHKYALFGWPTLQEASVITTVKDGTLKARCEKGKLEGYIDLTKRLRLNPADLELLQPSREGKDSNGIREAVQPRARTRFVSKVHCQTRGEGGNELSAPKNLTTKLAQSVTALADVTPRNGMRDQISLPARPLQVPPAPEPHVVLITQKNYGLPEAEELKESEESPAKDHAAGQKNSSELDYVPDQPFSISECRVGKAIRYGVNEGTIVKLIHDPFAPRIQVTFPDHPHPAMREVQLIVSRKRIKS